MRTSIINFEELWSPTDLGVKLLGWWDASLTNTITLISNVVFQWSDISGRGNHLTQLIATKRPTYGTFANRPAVCFDGADDSLLTTSITPQNVAIFAVYGYPNNNSEPPFVWSRNDGTNSNVQGLHLMKNGSIRVLNNGRGPYADTPTNTTQSFYADCILGGAYGQTGNSVVRGHLNGRAVQTTQSRQDANTHVHCFGMRDNVSYPSASRFTEIVMFTDWTLPDIQLVEGYLAHRWRGSPLLHLISDHPYINRPPFTDD